METFALCRYILSSASKHNLTLGTWSDTAVFIFRHELSHPLLPIDISRPIATEFQESAAAHAIPCTHHATNMDMQATRKSKVLSRRDIEAQIANGHSVVIVDNKVLKVDAWLPYHPGGDKAIRHMVGRDATDEVTR